MKEIDKKPFRLGAGLTHSPWSFNWPSALRDDKEMSTRGLKHFERGDKPLLGNATGQKRGAFIPFQYMNVNKSES